ncbi:DNA (cytosine-5)-methyltransferase 3B-like [Tubulanus polymorphus]|uniref:DNA (cytosine-5)-methyltransferase 3B-like n=1 Tax=Tubulanus polymorphus TaxID=672921 RepID=UPI003DA60DA8
MCGLPVSQWGKYWIFWFGDHKVSEMNREKIVLFGENFMKCYSKNAGKTLRRAVVEAIQECAARTRHYLRDDNEALLWALESFTGVTDINFSPQCGEELSVSIMKRLLDIKQIIRKKENNLDVDNKLFRIETACETTKANLFQEVRDRQRKIEDICIACDNTDVTVAAQHPFFYGGICGQCKSDIMETMFATGSDGLLMYCVVCGNGGELFVCDDPLCNRVYCSGCILSLAGKDVLEVVHTATPWLCFMCAEYNSFTQGLLKPKANWKNNIIDLFQPDGYQPISPDDFPRQPVRVLSLFDGIGTGKFVLNELGIKVEVYYASEIDQDAINVTKTQHGDAVIHIADVRQLDDEKLKQIGPIDLLIGGSPCNDLSLVNPARKGLGEGSGLLFFEYFRILTTIQSLQHRHLFWLFENVVSMPKDIKSTITRFLRCEPVLLDAIYFSAQKRARYFWGNIPGMYCPPQLEENPDPNLDEMLTPNCNRRATVSKIRTVTGRSNSIKQGKTVNGIMPVVMDGKEDGLWIPELERIFGFPAHYTDVGNLPPHKRQVLLGKSWSVPVIRKLLFPLKKFYETL